MYILQLSSALSPLKVKVKSLRRVWLFETPWTVAHQVPPPMRFSRQEYWSGLPFPSPGDLPDLTPLLNLLHTHTHTPPDITDYRESMLHFWSEKNLFLRWKMIQENLSLLYWDGKTFVWVFHGKTQTDILTSLILEHKSLTKDSVKLKQLKLKVQRKVWRHILEKENIKDIACKKKKKKEKKKIKATIQKNKQKDQNNISYDWFTLLKTLNWNSIRAQRWMI